MENYNLTERQEKLLKNIVEEYIKRVEPISSDFLQKKYYKDICPATIRIEMKKLTDRGYLYQPHTSAGRVPTDKSYRFFVDNLLEKELKYPVDFEINKEKLFKKEDDIFQIIQYLTRFIAKKTRMLTISYLLNEDFLWKEGWEEVLREPEFEKRDYVLSFTEFLERFENHIERYIKELKKDEGINVFIGEENPLPEAEDFSIIFSSCCLIKNEKGIISILGPKRMPYKRNLELINSLIKELKEENINK